MAVFELLRDIGVFGLAMWFIQNLLSKSADRKFESYKTELDHKSREFQLDLDARLEQQKYELTLHNFKATQVYEKQLSVIDELYKKLILLNSDMQEMTAALQLVIEDPEKEEQERIKKAGTAYEAFLQFYTQNKLYIPKTAIAKIENVRNDFFDSYWDYTFRRGAAPGEAFTYERAKAAGVRIKENIQPAINQLEDEFRQLLGVDVK
ncbi:hypothetical protein [Pontibacter chitinilyticus]|uniref:hypothetical protein n=1 Tax=Pontibacter chitinilyticus TaxID=2674989 RepID=UPI00321B683A